MMSRSNVAALEYSLLPNVAQSRYVQLLCPMVHNTLQLDVGCSTMMLTHAALARLRS